MLFSHMGLSTREKDIEGICNSRDEGQRHNVYVGLNGCRYVIFRDIVSEGSLRVHMLCVGEVEYMLTCVAFDGSQSTGR